MLTALRTSAGSVWRMLLADHAHPHIGRNDRRRRVVERQIHSPLLQPSSAARRRVGGRPHLPAPTWRLTCLSLMSPRLLSS